MLAQEEARLLEKERQRCIRNLTRTLIQRNSSILPFADSISACIEREREREREREKEREKEREREREQRDVHMNDRVLTWFLDL